MFFVLVMVALILALLIAWLLGGNLRLLADLRVRGGSLLVGAILLRLLAISPLPALESFLNLQLGPLPAGSVIYLSSLLLTLFVIVLNFRLPGLWLVGLGWGMNTLAIGANGGSMPVQEGALRSSGLLPAIAGTGGYSMFMIATPATPLWFLGDLLVIPLVFTEPVIISLGDLLLVAGIILLVYRATDRVHSIRYSNGIVS